MPVTKEQILKKLAERKRELATKRNKKSPANDSLKEAVRARRAPAKSPLREAGRARRAPAKSPLREAGRPNRSRVLREEMRSSQGPRTIAEAIQRKTSKMSKEQKHLYVTLAENLVKASNTLNEATQAGPSTTGTVGNGAGVGMVYTYFDIFFGYFPNLIVPEIASTQPIKTEKAMIFYYNSVAGSDKGEVEAGDVLISPFKINTDKDYTSSTVNLPKVGTDDEYSSGSRPLWGPFVARSLKIENAELDFSTDTAFTGTLDDDGNSIAITNGTVTLDNGQITVAMDLSETPSKSYKISYSYDNKYAPTQVPELNADIDSREITAKPRTIKTNYSFQAGFGFEAQFGVKLEDKLAENAMYQLKRETDLDFVFEIMNAAPVQAVWNKAAGVANGLYEWHKLSFRDAVVGASNHIFKISKRVRGNVLLVGPGAQSIVETLPEFKGEDFGSQIGGPSVIGKLKDIKVIAIPDLDDNDWAVIYKNEKDNLDAGIIFAPYIPVVATSPVTLDDFVIRRAYTMSYGKLVTNADYFVRGTIINDPVALPMYLISKDGSETVLGTIGDDAVVPMSPDMPS